MAEQLITIKNDALRLEISTLGAELQSVKKGETEYLWNGDVNVWKGRAPILFPICGGLKDDKYEFGGKTYLLQKHGFARFCEFETEHISQNRATFLLKSDEKSKEVYPFDFELRVTYILSGLSIKVEYSVLNKSNGDMYFSIGAHEGYYCPEGIEEYSLLFDKPENLTTNELHGNLLSENYEVLGENLTELPLKYDYFKVDALTFLNLNSRTITLKHNNSNRRVRIDFDGFDYTFVWTMAGKRGKYICIEPWCGLPDFEGTSFDFTKKRGINKIGGGETFNKTHTITIEG